MQEQTFMHDKRAKSKGLLMMLFMIVVVIVVVLGIIVGAIYLLRPDLLSAGGNVGTGNTPTTSGDWSKQFVYHDISAKNFYTSSQVNPTVKIYSSEPSSCWKKPRTTSCDEKDKYKGAYTLVNGTYRVSDLIPGHYYAIATLSGYYTEYQEFDVPKIGISGQSLSDYNQAPDANQFNMKQADTLTIENATFAAYATANTTGKEITTPKSYAVTTNYCIKPWKIVVYENNNSLTDYGTGVAYDGVTDFTVKIAGGSAYDVIRLANGVNSNFKSTSDTTESQTIDVESRNIEVCDGSSLDLTFYTKVNTRIDGLDTRGDRLMNNNETVAKIAIYDVQGTKIPASDYIWVKGSAAVVN